MRVTAKQKELERHLKVAEEDLAKYHADHPTIVADIKVAEEKNKRTSEALEDVRDHQSAVRAQRAVDLRIRANTKSAAWNARAENWHPDFRAAFEKIIGRPIKDADEAFAIAGRTQHTPLSDAMFNVERRVLEADSAVQAADKKFNAAVKMHREAQNKLSNISLDLQRVERRVGHAKRDLADYMEQRKLNEVAKADVDISKYEKIEHERRKVASTMRAVLDKIAAGETKVTW